MRKLNSAWNEFWFAPFDPLPAGLFRVSLGLLMIALYAALFPSWNDFYGVDGYASPGLSAQDPWCLFYWTEGILPIKAYWWIGFASAVAFAIGWRTRLFTVLLYVIQVSMIHRSPAVINGEDLVLRMLLFYGCFAPLGRSLSLDERLARKRRPAATCAVWPIRLIQINVALIYAFSVPYKLAADPAWRNGDALYWVMVNETWSRWPWPNFFCGALGMAGAKLMSFCSLLTEAAFPLLAWQGPFRPLAVGALAAMHVGIAVLLQNVTFFTLAMVCACWLYLPAPLLRRRFQRLQAVLIFFPIRARSSGGTKFR